MKKYLLLLFLLSNFCLPILADNYSLYKPQGYEKYFKSDAGEKILFILDLSNSMNELLGKERKFDLMIDTMRQILPKINPDTWVGLRVYGHKMGFTPHDACRASSLVTPISHNNSYAISSTLAKLQPRGMTPITYSLKQSLKYDFMGYPGKKHIILLTDGGENCDESPCKFVMELIKIRRDVQIDVIALSVDNSNDLEQLQCTAYVTSGKFYNAQTGAELVNGFSESINSGKRVEAKLLLP